MDIKTIGDFIELINGIKKELCWKTTQLHFFIFSTQNNWIKIFKTDSV